MLEVNNRDTRTGSLTLLWYLFSNFEQILFLFAVFLLLQRAIDLKGVYATNSRNTHFPVPFLNTTLTIYTTQKIKFSIKVFFR